MTVPPQPPTADPNVGRLLVNRYQLLELIGQGAMGRVYRAEDVLLGAIVAVKFLSGGALLTNQKMRDRFRSEARICAQLGHKSIQIVRVMDYGVSEDDVPFYVMEYLQGESLSQVISQQSIPLPRFLNLARQICLGLQCAHEGIQIDNQICPIIHRDIKPSNILICRDATIGEMAKVLDFGISKAIQTDGDLTSSFMGTLAYCAPEQMEGRELDARSDIYSLGIMMFEMMTGKLPIIGETHSFGGWYKAHHYQPPRQFTDLKPGLKLPKALEVLIMSCLAKSPSDRPQSIAEVLRSLEPLEQRYSAGRQIGSKLSEVLAQKSPPIPISANGTTAIEETSQLATWPSDKPVAQIVFPQLLKLKGETRVTLWVMLPQVEIDSFKVNRLYTQIYQNFLCSLAPHPMLLWITALYNPRQNNEKGPRWLRCYLDLKTSLGWQTTRLLGEQGKYQVFLFALENPKPCAHVIDVTLHPSQTLQMKEWAITGQSRMSIGRPQLSKNHLQEAFERMKPDITAKLENTSFKLGNS